MPRDTAKDLAPITSLSIQRKVAREEVRDLTEKLRKAILSAREEGYGVTQIAQAAGLSRQAIYDLLQGD